jgi:hypothetical protein
MLLSLLWVLQLSSADTLEIRSIERPPRPGETVDSGRFGPPQIRLRTRQGTALVWLLGAADTLFVAVDIPDSSFYWGDDLVLSWDTRGDGAPTPQHDDFQWYFRRVLDSSVVFRGRNGRWEPPRADPDWRLGPDRSGGGWEVARQNTASGWSLLLRLDPAWLVREPGRLPRLAFRIYDDAPHGWYAWPPPRDRVPATTVEQSPALWGVVKE